MSWYRAVLVVHFCTQIAAANFHHEPPPAIDDATSFAPLLSNFASNLYEEYRHANSDGHQSANEQVRHEIRDKIDAFVRDFPDDRWRRGTESERRRKRPQGRQKRDAFGYRAALVDSSAYTLSGFQENGTIPINFPVDLCLFDINAVQYAAALHQPSASVFNETYLSVFRNFGTPETVNLQQIYNYTVRSSQAMDCIGMGNVGYIALAYTMHEACSGPIVAVLDGSPVFQLTPTAGTNETRIEVVQYFNELHLNRVYFSKLGPELYFFQSFVTDPSKDWQRTSTNCLIYKWSGYHFDLLDELPCTNCMQIQPFFVKSDMFMAIANYRDANDNIDTFSVIYKYNVEHSKFIVSQKLRSHAAVDIKYFELAEAGKIERFLVIANSYVANGGGSDSAATAAAANSTHPSNNNTETHSIIYKHVNDYFTPFQSILLTDVHQFLPILGARGEFSLIIACRNQPTKVWQYNGWNFEQSAVQFTGGAFGSGVQRMRNYPVRSGTAIVVANCHMPQDATNIYLPLYAVRQSGACVSASQNWCAEAMDELATQPVHRILESVRTVPMATQPELRAKSPFGFQRVRGAKLTVTGALRTKRMVWDEALANQLRLTADRVKQMEGRLAAVAAMAKPELTEVTELTTQSIGRAESERLSEPEPADQLQTQQFDELHLDELSIGRTLNGHPIGRLLHTNAPIRVTALKAKNVYVKSRTVYDKLIALSNQKEALQMAETVGAQFATQVDELSVENLHVDGLINGLDLATLAKYALRTSGAQQLEAQFNFNSLKANAAIVQQGAISGRRLQQIVRTDAAAPAGQNTVLQDVRFTRPVSINELLISERLNSLRVLANGQLDVVRRQSATEQRITGHKTFEAVTLRNPIVLQGRLTVGQPGGNSQLADMNPIVAHSEDIQLIGDYVISGNVTINRVLRADDLLGTTAGNSVRRLLADGLRLGADGQPVVVDQSLEFGQPIRAREAIVSAVNSLDVRQWARSTSDIQEVRAPKVFAGDLRIGEGYCDALSVNGVLLQRLNETVLTRDGDQTVAGLIRLRRVTTGAERIGDHRLRGRPFTDYLNRRDQLVAANVTVRGSLVIRNAAQIQNVLSSSGRIDGHDVVAMMADTVMRGSGEVQQIRADLVQFNENVTFGRAEVGGRVLGMGTWAELQEKLRRMEETIEQRGPLQQERTLRVDDLLVAGEVNGMASGSFGRAWLLNETDQNFTASQTVLGVEAEQMWQPAGAIVSGVDVKELHENSVQLTDNLQLNSAQFETVVFKSALQVDGAVAGLQFPGDIVTAQSPNAQDLLGLRQIAGTLTVTGGQLQIGATVNGISVRRLCDFGTPETSAFALHVLGAARFEAEPVVAQLNGWSVEQLMREAWLADEETVLTGGAVHFADVEMRAPVRLAGTLNGYTTDYLRDHYISLSRDQTIHTHLHFGGANCVVRDVLEAAEVIQQAPGMVRALNRPEIAINIEHFCAHSLLSGVDQEITGAWQLNEVNVHGDLPETRINGLDFRTDLWRYSQPDQEIRAPKHFEEVIVSDIVFQNRARLQEIDVAEWLSKAVLNVGNNYTIQGTTVLENSAFFGDIRVFGRVNNRTFDANSILLKSVAQEIQGNVIIQNAPSDSRLIRPLTINEATFDYVNGVALNEFLANIVRSDDPDPPQIATPLHFNSTPVVGKFRTGGEWNGVNVDGLVQDLAGHMQRSDYTSHLGAVHHMSRALAENVKNRPRHLSAFRLVQTLDGHFTQFRTLRYSTANNRPRIIHAVIMKPSFTDSSANTMVTFYQWNGARSQLEIATELLALKPVRALLIAINVVRLYDRDYLIVECRDEQTAVTKLSYLTYLRNRLRSVYESLHNATQNVVEIQLTERSCVGFFTEFRGNELRVECTLLSDRGVMRMQLEQRLIVSDVAPIMQVLFRPVGGGELCVLDAQGRVSVWRQQPNLAKGRTEVRFAFVQSMQPAHLSRTISMTTYGGDHWLATCAAFQQNSTHMGSVDVYRARNGTYVHVQTIGIDVPIQAEITTAATSGELVLYALTESHLRPFIVYKYMGVTLFQQYFVATTLPAGREFRVLTPGRLRGQRLAAANETDVIAVTGAEGSLYVIQSVLE